MDVGKVIQECVVVIQGASSCGDRVPGDTVNSIMWR
jgi:hypothetical protein